MHSVFRLLTFLAFLSEVADWRPNLDGLVFDSLDSITAGWLERPFEGNEVYQVVCGVVKHKGPAQMDFLCFFFQTC